MILKLKVPSMVCDSCANIIKNSIIDKEPAAKIDVDLDAKQVIVETTASEESIKQTIIAAGHTVES